MRLREIVGLIRYLLFAKRGTMLEVGSAAPAFSVLDETGATRALSDFVGKTLVLWFYPKADTPG